MTRFMFVWAVVMMFIPMIPAHAQTAVPYGVIGGGVSITSRGTGLGPAVGPGFGGNAATVLAGGGAWVNSRIAVGGEVSFSTGIDAEQTEGGFGRCCTALSAEHGLTFWSWIIKARVAKGFALLTGPSLMHVATTATRVHRPLGESTSQPPVTTNSSTNTSALVFGAEGLASLSDRIKIVPGVRFFRRLKEPTTGDAIGMGSWTSRVTLSLQVTGRQ